MKVYQTTLSTGVTRTKEFERKKNRGKLPHVFALVVPVILCLAVAWALLRSGREFKHLYFPVACTVALLAATTPQMDPRFRAPIIPLLLLMAMLPRSGPDSKARIPNTPGTVPKPQGGSPASR